MDKHDIRFYFCQQFLQGKKYIGRNVEERLTLFHYGEVIVRNDVKSLQHLVEHLSMLACHTVKCPQVFMLPQFENQRAHFDGFGTGPED